MDDNQGRGRRRSDSLGTNSELSTPRKRRTLTVYCLLALYRTMASGFGRNKVGRCYSIFSAFETCMNTEPDSSVCYDFRKQYFNCLHLPTVNTMSEKQMDFMEERKDTLVLASKALQSGASGSAPAKPPGEEST